MVFSVRRSLGIAAAAVGFIAMGAAGAWAAMTVLQPAEDPLAAATYTFVEVGDGEVGSSLSLNAVAEWKQTPIGDNRAEGVVTSIDVGAGDEVSQGSVLFTVGLRPVVIAAGEVPAFREITAGTSGPDVQQIQQLLTDLGLYTGSVDGGAGVGTVSAIKAWQRSLGVEATGIVEPGDVIFVSVLPTRVALNDEIRRGVALIGGEKLVNGLSLTPSFSIPVTDAQASVMPAGTRVEITSPNGDVWEAFSGEQVRDNEAQTVSVALVGGNDAPICGENCGDVPVTGRALLPARVITVETVSGLVVTSAALVTTAEGQVAVIDEEGTRHAVSIVQSARGMSVIEGVDAGFKARAPVADGASG